jgi:hypothetical protein
LKLRFGFKDEKELKSAMRRAYHILKGDVKNVTKEDEDLVKRFTKFFELEPIKFGAFATENIYYLDFPPVAC